MKRFLDGLCLYDIYIYLDNADFWLFTRIIYWDFGDVFDPILNAICYMGNDLKEILEFR